MRVPTSGSLCKSSEPFIRSISLRQIVRPRPVPPKRRVVDDSACTNGSNRLRLHFRRNADAGVLDGDFDASERRRSAATTAHAARRPRPCGVNLMALPSRLNRICRNRTLSPRSVAATSGAISTRTFRPFSWARPGEQADGVVDQVAHVDRLGFDRQPSRFDLRIVEQVVENLQQRARRLVDHAQHFALVRIERRALQHFDEPEHAVHRRADFMAHHREEVVFRTRGRFGQVARAREFVGARVLDARVHPVAAPDDAAIRSRGAAPVPRAPT